MPHALRRFTTISGGSGIAAEWDAPPAVQATMAFYIIWFLLGVILLFFVFMNLSAIRPASARGPYVILAITTICFAVYNLLYGILIRIQDIQPADDLALTTSGSLLWNIAIAFLPGVVLYLLHQRGDVLRAIRGNTTSPLASQVWKRIVDWILVVIAFAMFTGAVGIDAQLFATLYESDYDYGYGYETESEDDLEALYQSSQDLWKAGLAFATLLAIDVLISSIIQFVQGRSAQPPDLVVHRLTMIVGPLFLVYAFELLFFYLFSTLQSTTGDYDYTYDPNVLYLAQVIIEGGVVNAITFVLILTMSLPGMRWTPQQVVAPETVPGAPPKDWSTPTTSYTPQYQPASYWPQPHVPSHQMPQVPYPYTIPVAPAPQQPIAEVHSHPSPASTLVASQQSPPSGVFTYVH